MALFRIFICFGLLWLTKSEPMTDQEFIRRLLPNYHKEELPPGSKPVPVLVQLQIHQFDPGDKMGKGSAQFRMKEKWYDERLAFQEGMEQEYVSVATPSIIWTPDTYIRNAESLSKAEGSHTGNLGSVRIYPDGTVEKTSRMNAELLCPSSSKHRLFPLDTQSCGIELSSFGNDAKKVKYDWYQENPITTQEGLDAETYDFKSAEAKRCDDKNKTKNDGSSCIKALLSFKREWLFFVTRYYVPTAIIVMLSWLAFWLTPKHAIAARIGIGLFCTACLLAFYGAISYMVLPTRTSATALDIWSWICLAFIILSLLESVLAHVLRKTEHHHGHHHTYEEERVLVGDGVKRRRDIRSKVLDAVAAILFPLAFIVFAVVYWVVYLLLHI